MQKNSGIKLQLWQYSPEFYSCPILLQKVWYLFVCRYLLVPILDDNLSIGLSHKSVLRLLYDYVKYVIVRILRNIIW